MTDKELRRTNNKLRVLAWEHETRCNRYKELKIEIEQLAEKYRYNKRTNNQAVYFDLIEIVDRMTEIDRDPHKWGDKN